MTERNEQTTYYPHLPQKVDYTGSVGTAGSALNAYTHVVRLVSTTACYFTLDGTTPSSTAGFRLSAEVPEYFSVKGGETIKAIRETSDGSLFVTEMTQ